jgi:hypothetical protein
MLRADRIMRYENHEIHVRKSDCEILQNEKSAKYPNREIILIADAPMATAE